VLSTNTLGCSALYQIQDGYLYQPRPVDGRVALPSGAERWWLDVEGGRVEAWYLPAHGTSDEPGPAVVFAHGNRELIDDWGEVLEPYREMGVAVLLPEFRSYGRSGGAPSEAALVADFTHFVDRLEDRPEIDPARVVFHGRSLGGGVVGVLSTRRRCAALVLESTFTNVPDLASRWMTPAAAIRDRYDTRQALIQSYTPTLIMHGVEDTLIPIRHASELHRLGWDSRLVAFDAGHSDVPHTEVYWAHVRELLTEAGVLREDD